MTLDYLTTLKFTIFMQKLFTLLSSLLFSICLCASPFYTNTCATFVQIGGTTYEAKSCGGNPSLNGAMIGTNVATLTLGFIQQFTDQGGGNVTDGTFHYKIYSSTVSSSSVPFTDVALNYDGSGSTATIAHRDVTSNVNLCTGLSGPLTYKFECYWSSNTTANGTIFDSNSGSNYIATFTTNASLAVTYIDILAKPTTKGVGINWSTATETDNAQFKIEHSNDGEVFNSIGEVKGAGNSKNVNIYSFTDAQPALGINYYRIVDIDYNGVKTTSKTVSVVYNGKSNATDVISISPNPTFNALNIYYNTSVKENSTLTIYDLRGRLIASQTINLSNGSSNTLIDVSNLLSGVYIVRINNDVQRFVKM